MKVGVVKALGRQPAMQSAAKGHDFGQRGAAEFWSGQQGIASDIEATFSGCTAARVIEDDGDATGPINRPTIARIESIRGKKARRITVTISHMLRHPERAAVRYLLSA